MAAGPVGVYFGIERIDLVQSDYRGTERIIRTAASVPYPTDREQVLHSPVELRKLVLEAFKSRPFRGRKIVTALPPNMVQLINMHYKCRRNQSNADALLKAIRGRFGDKLDDAVVDFLPIRPRVEDQVDRAALVAIAQQDTVVEFLESLRKAGLSVKALEVGPVAIQRLLSNLRDVDDTSDKIMAFNIAEVKSFVTVVWDGDLLLDREIGIGLESIVAEVRDALDISVDQVHQLLQTHGLQHREFQQAEQKIDSLDQGIGGTLVQILKPTFLRFADEIKKVLVYTASETQGGGIDNVYVLGGVSRWPGVDEYLTRLIGRPVKKLHPFFGFPVKDSSVRVSELDSISGMAVATGLSLREVKSRAGT
jgi:Tfp pilus assembly PilM family ATPase